MKKTSIILFGFFVAFASGCASTSQMQPNVPTTETTAAKQEAKHEPDNFDKAGFVLADGTRFVWNTSKAAWEWIDSPQHEEEVKKAGHVVKEMIRGAYEYGKQEMSKDEKK